MIVLASLVAAGTLAVASVVDPALVDAIAGLGALGFAIIAIGAFVFRRIHTRGELNDRDATWKERYAELDRTWRERFVEVSTDRDGWRTLAQSFGAKVDRLTDVVELLSGKKVD